MKISVAMATYNGEKYIIEQLESIRKQTFHVDEVIINDDCSTDGTVKLIEDYLSMHHLINWKMFINKANRGFSENFYEAVKKTNGDIIFLADQDDIWLSNKVEITQHVFNNNKTLKVLSSGQTFIDSNGENIDNSVKEITNENKKMNLRYLPFDFFIGSSVIPGCTMCIHKEIREFLFNFGAPDLSKSFGHDWYYCMVGAAIGQFALIDNVLIKRRIHENNASKASSRKTTILSTTTNRRNDYLVEIILAHQFFLNNKYFVSQLANRDIERVKKILRFFKKRFEFSISKNLFSWIGLGFSFFNYYHCSKSFKGAVQLYIADLFYTYNINWKTQNKTIAK